ncbi:hypothetical protein PRIPAC_72255 [Pristionchus pacificus]|uniref:Uncharacterized protein n=1 Tax=Pristionchus pacificus TaxID=54126 RepID=A0A2A6CR99_PRIPA|nr:hypothetical protein PRIPAC_72255 [Pristionchus pacificus]|eukprot:PDM80573.1 hypothetical protein PRIPAC_35576 [Pristionchus pacificus]
MLTFFLLSLFEHILCQPILPQPFYPEYGNQYGAYGGSPFQASYPGYPYGLTHFGTQASYQYGMPGMGYGSYGGYGVNGGYGGYNQVYNPMYQPGFQAFQQTPLTYDLHGGTNPNILDHASFLSLVNDKENFLANGCGWDGIQQRCTDGLGLCKGGCRDFSTTSSLTAHDCRCIPYGYAALLKAIG